MSTHVSTEALDRAAEVIASASEELFTLDKLNTALATKRTESQQADQQITEAMTALETAEAAAAVDPQQSTESARARLRLAREQKEYVDAAIAGLTRQRTDAIKLLKETLKALKIARNIRAQVRLAEIQAEMAAAVEVILVGLSKAKGVCIALGQSCPPDAQVRSLVGSENLLSSARIDRNVVDEEQLKHSDLRDLLHSVQSACGEY